MGTTTLRWCIALLAAGLCAGAGVVHAGDASPATAPRPARLAADCNALIEQAIEADGQGDPRSALRLLDEAQTLADGLDDDRLRARTHFHRAVILQQESSSEDALEELQEARRLYEKLGDGFHAARCKQNMAPIFFFRFGDEEAAWRHLDEAVATFRDAGDPAAVHLAQTVRARILMGTGDLERAVRLLQEAEDYFRSENLTQHATRALNLKSYALQEAGELEAARDAYLELLDAAFREGQQRTIAYAYCNLGDIEKVLGAPEVAESHLDRSIERLDRIRSRVPGGPQDRVRFLDTQIRAYHGKIALLVDRGESEAALAMAERFHARAFLETLDRDPLPEGDAPDSDEARAVETLLRLQARLLRGGLTADERTQLDQAEADWSAAQRERRRNSEAAPEPVRQIDVAGLRERLPEGTALLAYWVHPERTFCWLIRRDGVELFQVPVTGAALRERVESYLAPIRDRTVAEDTTLRARVPDHLQAGAELYRMLIAPLSGRLDDIRHLIVSPDSDLWYVPFEALIAGRRSSDAAPEALFGEYAATRFLVDAFSISYAPSATVWARLRDREPSADGFLAVAPILEGTDAARARGWQLPALPAARAEARGLATRFGGSRLLEGSDATERSIREHAPLARFVHFATHGYLHAERPDLSGLFLWPDDDATVSDGLFQGYEMREIGWRAELVTLAVCNSGLGQLSRGEGLVGLSREILAAGAQSVVVSLWPVHDRASAALMQAFYGHVADGQSLPEALRSAKLELAARVTRGTVVLGDEPVAWAQPYFWAPFVLVGGAGPEPPFPGGHAAPEPHPEVRDAPADPVPYN